MRDGIFRDDREFLDGLRKACVEGAARIVDVSILSDLRKAAACSLSAIIS